MRGTTVLKIFDDAGLEHLSSSELVITIRTAKKSM
jgi:hypothetical protein